MTPPPETGVDEVAARRALRQSTDLPEPALRPGHIGTRAHAAALEDVLRALVPIWSDETRATAAQTLAEAVYRIEPLSSQAKSDMLLMQRDDAYAVIDQVRDLCRSPVSVVLQTARSGQPFNAVPVPEILAVVGGDR